METFDGPVPGVEALIDSDKIVAMLKAIYADPSLNTEEERIEKVRQNLEVARMANGFIIDKYEYSGLNSEEQEKKYKDWDLTEAVKIVNAYDLAREPEKYESAKKSVNEMSAIIPDVYKQNIAPIRPEYEQEAIDKNLADTQEIELPIEPPIEAATKSPRPVSDIERYQNLLNLAIEKGNESDVTYFTERLERVKNRSIPERLEPVVAGIEAKLAAKEHDYALGFIGDKDLTESREQSAADLVSLMPRKDPFIPKLDKKMPTLVDRLPEPEQKAGFFSGIKNFLFGRKLEETVRPTTNFLKPSNEDKEKLKKVAEFVDFDYKRVVPIPTRQAEGVTSQQDSTSLRKIGNPQNVGTIHLGS